jgi:hypothetical protein
VGAMTTMSKIKYVCTKSNKTKKLTLVKRLSVAKTAAPVLIEQPNRAKYAESFADIYLGKMNIGKKIGTDSFPTKSNIFTSGVDQFCTMMTLKKTISGGHFAGAIYDTANTKYSEPKSVFPIALKAGGTGGCSRLTQSSGKYEDKRYVDHVFVAVLPYEVK